MPGLFKPSLAYLVIAAIAGFSLAGNKVHADSIKLLCLGDSITQSSDKYSGYRYLLWKKLLDSNLSIDFVGSLVDRYNDAGESGYAPYKGQIFDRDHEGHWGWTAAQILDGAVFMPKESGTGMLTDWIRHYTADIVLIHLGHNDIGRGSTPQQISALLIKIARLLQNDNPDVMIFLAKVIPSSNYGWNQGLIRLNTIIEETALKASTDRSPVITVDLAAEFDPGIDTDDGVHPNNSGSSKMADRWFEAIISNYSTISPGSD